MCGFVSVRWIDQSRTNSTDSFITFIWELCELLYVLNVCCVHLTCLYNVTVVCVMWILLRYVNTVVYVSLTGVLYCEKLAMWRHCACYVKLLCVSLTGALCCEKFAMCMLIWWLPVLWKVCYVKTLCRLLLGWVTAHGQVNRLGI